MKLSEVLPSVVALIKEDTFFEQIPIITSSDIDYNNKMHAAINTSGILMVVTLAGGQRMGDSKLIDLSNTVAISVVENPAKNKNYSHAINIVERLLGHLHNNASGKGPLQIKIDKEAYETGPIEGGLIVFFVNFNIRTINP